MRSVIFHLRFGWHALRQGGQQSLFSLICIATGVATMVAVQVFGAMIVDRTRSNVQALAGGDVVVTPSIGDLNADELEEIVVLQRDGRIDAYTSTLWGGVEAEKPGSERSTIVFVQGVEVDHYPLYGSVAVEEPADAALSELLNSPADLVISRNAFERLNLALGDQLTLSGRSGKTHTGAIRGVVSTSGSSGSNNMLLTGYVLAQLPVAREIMGRDEGAASQVFIKTASPQDNVSVAVALRQQLPLTKVETAQEIAGQAQQQAGVIERIVLLMGLFALLMGGIGIIDTMQVTMHQQRQTIGIFKAVGGRTDQIMSLLLAQAAVLGLTGAAVGVIAGEILSFLAQGIAARFLFTTLTWRLYPAPILFGLLAGAVITVVMGALPALEAARVPPLIALRSAEEPETARGCLFSLPLILLLTGLIGLFSGLILRSLLVGLAAAYILLLFFILASGVSNAIIWLVERLPKGRSLTLKLVLRDLGRQRRRMAISLLTIMIGIFALGGVLLVSETAKSALSEASRRNMNYNLQIVAPDPSQADTIRQEIEAAPGLISYSASQVASVSLRAINGQDALPFIEEMLPTLEDTGVLPLMRELSGRNLTQEYFAEDISQGRDLLAEDAGRQVVLVVDGIADPLGVAVGDTLTFELSAGEALDLQVAGIIRLGDMWMRMGGGFVAPIDVLGDAAPAQSAQYDVRIESGMMDEAYAYLARRLPSAIVLNLEDMTPMMDQMVDQFALFPTLLAILSLVVGVAVIGNSVHMSLLARRRQLGLLKVAGAQPGHVLKLLLLENGIVSLTGSILGTLAAALGALLIPALFQVSASLSLPLVVALILLGLFIALIVTVLTAWPIVNQLPLGLLRYE